MNNNEVIWSDWRKEIILFDTTLRDGHQCPWAWIENDKDYFNIVRGLDSIGFDICEVGFPSSSKHEWWRVSEVAQMVESWEISTIVWWLTQMVDFQVDATLKSLEAVSKINKWFFHIYFPVDPNLREASIWKKISNEQALKDIAKFSKLASDMWLIVQFSPEGYSKVWNDFDFCTEAMITAAENWATYFNLPDTIWWQDKYNNKDEYYVDKAIRHRKIMERKFPNNSFVFSVHNHNDLWTAVDNSIAAVLDWTWISKIEWTINWVWERAGNADLNQVVTRMKTSLDNKFNIDHINASEITRVSNLVSNIMLPVQPNYPIVWENAMKHTSGWHTRAMLKNPTVYQPFDPEVVWWEISFVYWPNSGWNLAIDIINKQWYFYSFEDKRELDEFLKSRMKETGRYKWLTNNELLDLYFEFRSPIKINDYSKTKLENSENISVIFDGEIFWEQSIELEWETVFMSLKEYLSDKIPWYNVWKYSSQSETSGSSSKAETMIEIMNKDSWENIIWIGRDNDTEVALLKALANAFNKIYINENYKI